MTVFKMDLSVVIFIQFSLNCEIFPATKFSGVFTKELSNELTVCSVVTCSFSISAVGPSWISSDTCLTGVLGLSSLKMSFCRRIVLFIPVLTVSVISFRLLIRFV